MDLPSGFPSGSVKLEPVSAFDQNVSSGDSGEELLCTLDLAPEGLQVGHV